MTNDKRVEEIRSGLDAWAKLKAAGRVAYESGELDDIRFLLSELDRALKRIEALRQMRDSMNRGDYDCMDWCDNNTPCQNCRAKMAIDAILSDAPTENKSNG